MKVDESSEIPLYGVVIIGAGVSGLYQLYKAREIGVSALVLESGTEVGGTWYWNRYPGARFDSESYSYGYSFSQDLLDEWDWKEHFSAQPENLRYLQHVSDRFDLREDIRFESTVTQCIFDEISNEW
ncbi:MAG: NAD(P)-binding protein, partial [Actinomycetota bacterium]|nr:NAD(P)-binding protein [Actinomycetota bacterium]